MKGKEVTVNVTVELSEKVTGGSIAVEVKYGIIPIYDTTLDLCDTLKEIGMVCPVAPGTYDKGLSVAIPSEIPGVSCIHVQGDGIS